MSVLDHTGASVDAGRWGAAPLEEMRAAYAARRERLERVVAPLPLRRLPFVRSKPAAPSLESMIVGWVARELIEAARNYPVDTYPVVVIQKVCAAWFDVTVVEILSKRRFAEIVEARHVAMYLAKVMTPRSLPNIGRRFGPRDHTAVLHAVSRIKRKIELDPAFATTVKLIRERIEATA